MVSHLEGPGCDGCVYIIETESAWGWDQKKMLFQDAQKAKADYSSLDDSAAAVDQIEGLNETKAEVAKLSFQISQQTRFFHAILSSISDFAYVFDADGRFVFINQALLDLWGLKLEDAVGKNFFDLKYPDDLAARLQRQIQQVYETRQRVIDETPYTSPTGVVGYYDPCRAKDRSCQLRRWKLWEGFLTTCANGLPDAGNGRL